jgi:hypothetical protein
LKTLHKEITWDTEKDNIKLGPKEMVCEGVNWIELAHGGFQWWALVNVVMNP